MSVDNDLWLLLPEPVRRLPADLAAVIAVVVATNVAALAPVIRETPLRVVVGLAFVLFVPGYAFIAALFPEAGASPTEDVEEDGNGTDDDEGSSPGRSPISVPTSGRGIDGIERVALSFGLSIAIVPLLGLVLNFTPWGIRLVPILIAVSGFTLIATGVAAVRRWELDPDERFRVPYRAWVASARSELLEPDSRADAALNVLLVLSILLAVGSVTYAVAVPKQGEQFTEFYILTENESGDLVADDYPQNFTAGDPRSVHVGIGNHEFETVDYTVVVVIQDVRFENNQTTILDQRELDRYRATVDHNETWIRQREVAPTMVGDRLRLKFLLYRGDPPTELSAETAYRDLHLWVNVSESGNATTLEREIRPGTVDGQHTSRPDLAPVDRQGVTRTRAGMATTDD